MEPSVVTIVLHPAILVASGFECLTTKQMRFLDNHKSHFSTRQRDWTESCSLSPEDFKLGGLLNPHGRLEDPDRAYVLATDDFPRYPIATWQDIFKKYYVKELTHIWQEILVELCLDLHTYCHDQSKHAEELAANSSCIHQMSKYPIYQKITALHLCGLGDRMADAFDFVFTIYQQSGQIKTAQM